MHFKSRFFTVYWTWNASIIERQELDFDVKFMNQSTDKITKLYEKTYGDQIEGKIRKQAAEKSMSTWLFLIDWNEKYRNGKEELKIETGSVR